MSADEATNTDEPVIQTNEKKKRSLKKWQIVIIVIVFGIGALIAAGVSSARGAISAGNEFVAHLQNGECGTMYDKSSDGFKDSGTKDEWEQACQRISEVLQGAPEQRGVEVSSGTGRDQVSTVTYLIDGTDDKTYGVAISMVNQDGGWKLAAIDSDELTEEDLQELDQE